MNKKEEERDSVKMYNKAMDKFRNRYRTLGNFGLEDQKKRSDNRQSMIWTSMELNTKEA